VIVPDCQACGACCAHPDDPEWVEVYLDDLTKLPRTYVRQSTTDFAPLPTPPYVMRQDARGACCALQGTIGVSARCGIYDQRPAACRAIARGSPVCCWCLGRHRVGRPW
jgi:Fe-S-cluster containining protein